MIRPDNSFYHPDSILPMRNRLITNVASSLRFFLMVLFLCISHTSVTGSVTPTPTPVPVSSELANLWTEMTDLRSNRASLAVTLDESLRNNGIEAEKNQLIAEWNAIEAKTTEMQQSKLIGFGQVSSLRARAWKMSISLTEFTDKLKQQLQDLQNQRTEWEKISETWTTIRNEMKNKSDFDAAKPLLSEAETIISSTLRDITMALTSIVESQQQLDALKTKNLDLLTELDTILRKLRLELFKRNSPAMVSPAYFDQFNMTLLRSFHEHVLDLEFRFDFLLTSFGWLIILQIFIMVTILILIKRPHPTSRVPELWTFLARRPWSHMLFFAIVTVIPIYKALPDIWRLIFWVILSITTIRIMTVSLKLAWQKRLIVLVMTPFIISLLFQIIQVPFPLFRLYIAGVALLGIPISIQLARWIERAGKENVTIARALYGGGLLLFFVLIAQLIGFSALANHFFESSVKSVFLAFFTFLFLSFVNRSLDYLLRIATQRGVSFIAQHQANMIRILDRIVQIVMSVLFVLFFTTIWGIYDSPMQAWYSLSAFGITIGDFKITVGTLFAVGLIIYGTVALSRAAQTILAEEFYPRKNIDKGIGVSFNRLLHYALIVIGFFWVLSILGFSLQNVTIIGGALGIGIGFGLQNIVSNFVSGLILLIEQPVKVGDVVVINSEWGQILKLGLRATVIETFDRSEIIIPNSDLITGSVVNWTRVNRSARLKLPIGVSYNSDIIRVISLIQIVAQENPLSLKDPAPKVQFLGYGDSSLDLELWVWVEDLANRVTLKTQLLQTIFIRFQEEGIEIPFPQRDIHIRSTVQSEQNQEKNLIKKLPDASDDFPQGD